MKENFLNLKYNEQEKQIVEFLKISKKTRDIEALRKKFDIDEKDKNVKNEFSSIISKMISKKIIYKLNGAFCLESFYLEAKSKADKRKKYSKVCLSNKNRIFFGKIIYRDNFFFVEPQNEKINKQVRITNSNKFNFLEGNVCSAKITKLKGDIAECEIQEVFREKNGCVQFFIRELFKEYRFDSCYSEECKEEEKKFDENITLKDRIDLTKLKFITIDGEDTKDIDDGVAIKRNANGYTLYIPIADVSEYVKQDSATDKEAYSRGISHYLGNDVHPMLLKKLSNGVCSLNPREYRYAVTSRLSFDKDGFFIKGEILNSVIESKEQMTYTNIDKIIIDKDVGIRNKYKEYIEEIECMYELAKKLRKNRINNGKVDLDIPELTFEYDSNGMCINLKKSKRPVSMFIIEEFMLSTNEYIAKFASEHDLPILYRNHEAPNISSIRKINPVLKKILGNSLRVTEKNGEQFVESKEFGRILDMTDEEKMSVISELLLRCMERAYYSVKNKGHYAIGSNSYCHFTSPIRRYPDLWNHRVIMEYVLNGFYMSKERKEELLKTAQKVAKHVNETSENAKKMEWKLDEILSAQFMDLEKNRRKTWEASIVSVSNLGIYVLLLNGVQGLIPLDISKRKDKYAFDSVTRSLYDIETEKSYLITDSINVKVKEVSILDGKIFFQMIESN